MWRWWWRRRRGVVDEVWEAVKAGDATEVAAVEVVVAAAGAAAAGRREAVGDMAVAVKVVEATEVAAVEVVRVRRAWRGRGRCGAVAQQRRSCAGLCTARRVSPCRYPMPISKPLKVRCNPNGSNQLGWRVRIPRVSDALDPTPLSTLLPPSPPLRPQPPKPCTLPQDRHRPGTTHMKAAHDSDGEKAWRRIRRSELRSMVTR